ncbi:MAG TPA: hypothetical protein P5060_02935 [Candidatus Absconditabacterales bacterium]|nr:hypothetical protein [Candidatus Absconditabacterales bacterium]
MILNTIRLVDLVKDEGFLTKIYDNYDLVVSDFDFGGKVKNIVSIKDILDLDRNKRILFVLDQLLIENILDNFDGKSFDILDMNFGVASVGQKIAISKIDIQEIIERGFDIYEPFDQATLLFDLSKKGNKYIRINNFYLPDDFGVGTKDILSLAEKGIYGDDFTLVFTGSMLSESIRLTNLLNEKGLTVNIMILNKLNFDLLDIEGEKIIFAIDQLNGKRYEDFVKSRLKGKNIKFLYPEYDSITTVFDEYQLEEAKFDAKGLFERMV